MYDDCEFGGGMYPARPGMRRLNRTPVRGLKLSFGLDFLPGEDMAVTDDFEQALAFETLAASLKMDQKAAADMVEQLARMLSSCLPDSVEIKRGGNIFSKEKPVEQMTIKFDDAHYQIVKVSSGRYTAKHLKIVRGVALKTTEMPFDKCFNEVVQNLAKMAENNAAARMALNKFVLG